MFAKKHLPLIILIALVVISFLVFPSLRHILFKPIPVVLKGEKKEDPVEKFNRLLTANGYLSAPFDQYSNFRFTTSSDGRSGTAYFQTNKSIEQAKALYNLYLVNSTRLTKSTPIEIKERKINGGVELLAMIQTQPLNIQITKVSDKVSAVGILFQISGQSAKDSAFSSPELPKNFPSGVPVNRAISVTRNAVETIKGITQGTLVFQSEMNPDQNFNFYKNYFSTTPGWGITNQINSPKFPSKAIFVSHTSGVMTVNINVGSLPGTSIVSLMFSGK